MRTTMKMPTLHDDLISYILQRLPVKSLLRFRCVCESWSSLISDPSFIQMHLNHSRRNQHLIIGGSGSSGLRFLHSDVPSLSYPSTDEAVKIDNPFKTYKYRCVLLASCDGLLLISAAKGGVCLYNPSTKEFRELPFEFPKNSRFRKIIYGLGFDKIINNYKVIRVTAFCGLAVATSEVKVYTLGTNSWRKIENFPKTLSGGRELGISYNDLTVRNGQLVNGYLHWLVTYTTKEDVVDANYYDDELEYTEWKSSKVIVSLDIENEKYDEVPQPDYIDDNYNLNVGVLDGCLCLLANYDKIRTDVWLMKNYGVKESWTRLFMITQPTTIPSFDFVLPIKFIKNGEMLLLNNKSLILYEPRYERARTLAVRGVPNWFETEIYVESLIPLKSGMYVRKEPAQRKKRVKKIRRSKH